MLEVAIVMLVAAILIVILVGIRYFGWRLHCQEQHHKSKGVPLAIGQLWSSCHMTDVLEVVSERPGHYVTLRIYGTKGDSMWVESIADWEKRRDSFSMFIVGFKNADLSPEFVVQ